MKSIKVIALSALVALMGVSCCNVPSVEPQPEGLSKASVDTASYALGVFYAQAILSNNLGDMNYKEVVRGFKDALKGDNPELNQMFVSQHMMKFMRERSEIVAQVNKQKGEEFLAKNVTVEGVESTFEGLQYMVVRKGNGVYPTNDKDTVLVSYEGSTLDGKVFDSSYERQDTVSFPLDRVIEGWTKGLKFCDEGSEVTLWIPSDMAYGMNGPMGPNQTLKFKVELHKVLPYVEKEAEAETK